MMKKINPIRLINYNLIKCPVCNGDLGLNQKSIRYQNKWFHADCLKSTNPKKTTTSQQADQVYKTSVITEKIYAISSTKNENLLIKPTQVPPLKQTTVIQQDAKRAKPHSSKSMTSEPAPTLIEKHAKVTPDPVLVTLAVAIFSLLVYTAYSIFSVLSIVAIGAAAIIAFYHILSRKPPQTQYEYKTKNASFYSVTVMIMPFGFSAMMALDGYLSFMTIAQAIFVWSLALSFWQMMLFVPLAIRSITREAQLRLANRGWEYLDHTAFGAPQQAASIRQTNDNLAKVFDSKPTMFAPPYGAFNKDTIEAAKQEKMLYLSASITTDRPPFAAESLRHVPATVSFTDLVDDDPFLAGTIQQKSLTKVQANIRQYGFAVVSLQPSDFAIKTDSFKNEVDVGKLKLLESLISGIKSNGTEIVMLQNIPAILDDKSILVPDWIKNNAGWWAEGKIGNSDFVKGIQYLIENGIIQV